jgi:glutaredoxin
MLSYALIAVIISLTLFIFYLINRAFEVKPPDKIKETVLDIKSDHVVILSLEGCSYCKQLNEKIKESDVKYTTVTLKDNVNFEFDNSFTELPLEERDNIVSELQKLIKNGNALFPSIIVKNEIYEGLPNEEMLNKIFNV